MHNKMKRFCGVVLALLLLTLPMITVYAEVQEADSILLEHSKDIVFWVEWDVHTPDVVFIAPDGTVYDPNVARDNTETVINELSMFYVVHGAQAGQWRIRYDKGTNTKLDVSVHDYSGGIHVEKFEVGTVEGSWINVAFLVEGKENVEYNYRISAVVERSGSEKELRNGTGVTGHEVGTSVNLSQLSSYSAYMLKLYVWYDDEGTDIFDVVYSEPFSYTNSSADERVVEYSVTVIPDEYLVEVHWGDVPWDMDSAIVALFEDDAAEPLIFDEHMVSDNSSVQLSYDPRAKKIAVEVTAKLNGTNVLPVRKTIDLKNIGVTLPQGELFNSLTYPIAYSGFSKQNVDILVGETKTAAVFDGSGKVNVTLADDWNTVSLSYKDAQGITWKVNRKVFVDRMPPVLTMNQAYDGISVDTSEIVLGGSVSGCHTLTVNGVAVAVDANGVFSHTVSLSGGSNTVSVVATDKAGNEVRYTAGIYYGDAPQEQAVVAEDGTVSGGLLETLTAKGNYWVLLVSGVLCLLVIGYALVFWRKGDKKQ